MKQNSPEFVEYIDHDAVVVNVNSKTRSLTVSLTPDNDCHACPAARLCSIAADGKDKSRTLTVEAADAASFHPGDRVTVRGTERMHHRAILIATVIPCLLLLAIMSTIYILTRDQAASALGGIAAMLFFFTLLYLLRNKIRHEFLFTIHKQ